MFLPPQCITDFQRCQGFFCSFSSCSVRGSSRPGSYINCLVRSSIMIAMKRLPTDLLSVLIDHLLQVGVDFIVVASASRTIGSGRNRSIRYFNRIGGDSLILYRDIFHIPVLRTIFFSVDGKADFITVRGSFYINRVLLIVRKYKILGTSRNCGVLRRFDIADFHRMRVAHINL